MPEPSDAEETPKLRNGNWVLAATILASSMAFIDGTAVTVALPAIQDAFQSSANQIQWVVEPYALFLASLLLVGGSVGDHYGRRIVFTVGVTLFAAGSVLCGLAQSISWLLMARGLQGIGPPCSFQEAFALVSAFFPSSLRGRAIGIWSGFSAMTAAIGSVLGGWLVDHTSWRWVFFINPPIAIFILIIAFRRVLESRGQQLHQRLDWAGALLATVAFAGTTFALIEGRRPGPMVPVATGVGVAALLGFVFAEMHVRTPMLPLRVFRSRTFTGANLLTFFLYTALNGLLFFFPLNLIQVQRYPATQAGAALLPLVLTLFLLSH